MMLYVSFLNRFVWIFLILGAVLSGCSHWARKPEEPPKIYDSRAVEKFVEATIAEELQDYYRAIVLYQEALHRDSTSVTIHLALASLHQHLGQTESALTHLNAAAAISPEDPYVTEWIVELLGNLERWEDQEPYVRRLLKLDSNNLAYNLQLANIYLKAGDRKSARRVFRKVIKLAADDKTALLRLGVMLILNEEPELAERCYYQACQIDPTDDQAHLTLERIYRTMEKEREARKRFAMAIAINDTVLQYWTNLAFMDMEAERYDQVEFTLKRALQAVPDHPALLNLLGSALERQDRYEEALKSCTVPQISTRRLWHPISPLALFMMRLTSLHKRNLPTKKHLKSNRAMPPY